MQRRTLQRGVRQARGAVRAALMNLSGGQHEEGEMENLIMGLFLGLPAALGVAALLAWYRTSREYYEVEGM